MVLTHLEPPRLAELRSDFFYLAGPVWNVEGTDQRRRGDGDLASARAGVRVTDDLHRVTVRVDVESLRVQRYSADCQDQSLPEIVNVAPNGVSETRPLRTSVTKSDSPNRQSDRPTVSSTPGVDRSERRYSPWCDTGRAEPGTPPSGGGLYRPERPERRPWSRCSGPHIVRRPVRCSLPNALPADPTAKASQRHPPTLGSDFGARLAVALGGHRCDRRDELVTLFADTGHARFVKGLKLDTEARRFTAPNRRGDRLTFGRVTAEHDPPVVCTSASTHRVKAHGDGCGPMFRQQRDPFARGRDADADEDRQRRSAEPCRPPGQV